MGLESVDWTVLAGETATRMDEEYLRQLEVQRAAFEAQFGSLESMGFEDKTKTEIVDEEEGSESEEEQSSGSESFHGFSEDEGGSQDEEESEEEEQQPREVERQRRGPKVVKFQETETDYKPSKKEQRLIRSGKVPTLQAIEKASASAKANANDSDSDPDQEQENLRNDIELQRFLKESHLISAFQTDKNTIHDSELHGKARARTLETRLQSLSATNAVRQRTLETVPMNIRKGMVKKHNERITKYESEARDAGTVLSRVSRGEFRRIDATYKKDIERRIGRHTAAGKRAQAGGRDGRSGPKRDFGLKVQTVGRSTRNGLKLSAADIAKIRGK